MFIKHGFSNIELATTAMIILCGSPLIIPAVHAANHVINPPIITTLKTNSKVVRSSLYHELRMSDDYHYSNGLTPPVLQSKRYSVLNEI
ncbi:hypothetical protein [Vibrio rumoiensis]|uniref:hypothetical protein n=1 Tax=Vibrio rumoiensis TaxID=76258 RepID=UPI000B5C620D|nr:hypothetical protein [Vibrio rumoiensis]